MSVNENRDSDNEFRQFDRFARRFSEIYLVGKERGREAMAIAIESAREEFAALEELSAEKSERLKRYLENDLDQTIQDFREMSQQAKQAFNRETLESGALASIAAVLEKAGKEFLDLSNKAKAAITFKTGEVTSAGTLVCQACSKKIHLQKTGRVPPCPGCKGTVYIKKA